MKTEFSNDGFQKGRFFPRRVYKAQYKRLLYYLDGYSGKTGPRANVEKTFDIIVNTGYNHQRINKMFDRYVQGGLDGNQRHFTVPEKKFPVEFPKQPQLFRAQVYAELRRCGFQNMVYVLHDFLSLIDS